AVFPSSLRSAAPIAGAVLWQHEQPGQVQSWVLIAEPGWQADLHRKDWGAEAGERYWRKGAAELDVMELEHEQQRCVLVSGRTGGRRRASVIGAKAQPSWM